MPAICAPSGTSASDFVPFCSEAGFKYHFGRIWDTLGHFGTSRGSGKPFEGGMERERTRAICAPSGTPAYDLVPFRSEAGFKYKFWSDVGHFGTLWDISGLHGGAGSRLMAEWDESVREVFVHHQEPQRTISYHSVQRRPSNISFGRIWDTLGHFGTFRDFTGEREAV